MDPHQFSTDALLQSVFRDDYGLDAALLESLYSKSKRHQWNAELDVDWSRFENHGEIIDQKPQVLSRVPAVQALPEADRAALYRESAIFTISQVLHGEQAALMTCGQLVNLVPDMEGKFAASVQVMDEARHVEVFARYLKHCGSHYPIDPDLQAIVQGLLGETDWEAKCVGMQVILESVALAFFRLGQDMATEPVFSAFIGRVHEDESRHVAYGVLSLERRIPQLAPEARARLENFAYDAVARIAGRCGRPTFATQFKAIERAGIDVGAFLPKLLDDFAHPDRIDWNGLRDPMVDTVIPNLLRVGLVPERLAEGYLAQGFEVDVAKKTVRDLHSFHPAAREARAALEARGRSVAQPW